jgi:peptidoglycan/xylan/chitin deacetylase (PgdA/CDA1 family)
MDRRTFLLAAGVLGALTACSSTVSGQPVPTGPGSSGEPTGPTRPVLQTGPPAVTPSTPKHTVIATVPDDLPLVALTVDDGVSSDVVRAYVELAAATGIRLTFFANGVYSSWADNQKRMQPLVDSGQIVIGNHTWDHPDITTISRSALADQLTRNDKALANLYGRSTRPLFRPPYMAHNDSTDQVAVDQGYPIICWWTGSFGDSTQITAEQVLANARQYLRAGTIVIGHANFPPVTSVFDDIIGLLQERSLQTVTLADVYRSAPA